MSLKFLSTSLLAVLFFLGGIVPVKADRAAPKPVKSILIQSVRYSAPASVQEMGFVIASDAASGKELWRKRIFRVFMNPFLEEDVQWVFITSLVQHGQKLLVTNEQGERFTLDLKTKGVRRSK